MAWRDAYYFAKTKESIVRSAAIVIPKIAAGYEKFGEDFFVYELSESHDRNQEHKKTFRVVCGYADKIEGMLKSGVQIASVKTFLQIIGYSEQDLGSIFGQIEVALAGLSDDEKVRNLASVERGISVENIAAGKIPVLMGAVKVVLRLLIAGIQHQNIARKKFILATK